MINRTNLFLIIFTIATSTVFAQEFTFKRHEIDILPEFSFETNNKFFSGPKVRYRYFIKPKWAVQTGVSMYDTKFQKPRFNVDISALYYFKDEQRGFFVGLGGSYSKYQGIQLSSTIGYKHMLSDKFFISAELDLKYTTTPTTEPGKRADLYYSQPKAGIGIRF